MSNPDIRDCPICKGKNEQTSVLGRLSSTIDNLDDAQEFYRLVSCRSCDLIYLSPLPAKDVFDQMYVERLQFEGADAYTGIRAQNTLDFYRSRLRRIVQRANLDRTSLRSLEIGSGYGWVSNVVKGFSKRSITVAQDVSAEGAESCPWIDRYCIGELQDVAHSLREYAPYQIISMTHVIEHLRDPLSVLTFCRQLLDRHGIIFITAPHRPKDWAVSASFSAWKDWVYNHVPAHLQYFNEKSMRNAARHARLKLLFFDAMHEEGQAFEAWLGGRNFPLRSHLSEKALSWIDLLRRGSSKEPEEIANVAAPAPAEDPHEMPVRASSHSRQGPHDLVGGAIISRVRLLDSNGSEVGVVESGDETTIEVDVEFSGELVNPDVGFVIRRSIYGRPTIIYDTNTLWRGEHTGNFLPGDVARIRYRQRMELGLGHYTISAAIASADGKVFYDWREAVISFDVVGAGGMQGIANLHSTVEIHKLPDKATGLSGQP